MVKKEAQPGIWTFEFQPRSGFKIKAGQHLLVNLPHENPDDRGTIRLFSPSSAPHEGMIRITLQYFGDKGSSFKRALFQLIPNTEITIRGPVGTFLVKEPVVQPLVFIAGGVGITPIRSILSELQANKVPYKGTLLYANHDTNYLFGEELESFAKENINFSIRKITSPNLIHRETIEELNLNGNELFYVAGSPSFITSIVSILKSLRIPSNRIKYDKFRPIKGGGYK